MIDTDWADAAAAALTGGRVETCAAGHRLHTTLPVSVRLSGRYPTVPDWPAVPAGFEQTLDLMCFDTAAYRGTVGYCPGDDEVSRSLLAHGAWEGFETALVLTILGGDTSHGGWVVDIGSHLGWYTLLASSWGYQVVAVEANPETLSLLGVNCDLNNCASRVVGVRGWVGPDTPPVPAGPQIRLVKADIEGLEADAVRVFEPSLAAGLVDFLMLELTAAFNDRWRDAVSMLDRYGYAGYAIPDKADRVDLTAYTADPLAVTFRRPLGDLTGTPQVNALFAREGLR